MKTHKETLIKYLIEMDLDMISLLLDAPGPYCGANKVAFLKTLEQYFEHIKERGAKKMMAFKPYTMSGRKLKNNEECILFKAGYDAVFFPFIFELVEEKVIAIHQYEGFLPLPDKYSRLEEHLFIFCHDELFDFEPTEFYSFVKKKTQLALNTLQGSQPLYWGMKDLSEWLADNKPLYDKILYTSDNYAAFQEFTHAYSVVEVCLRMLQLDAEAECGILEKPTRRNNERQWLEWLVKYESTYYSSIDHKQLLIDEKTLLESRNIRLLNNYEVYISLEHIESVIHFYKIMSRERKKAKYKYRIVDSEGPIYCNNIGCFEFNLEYHLKERGLL